MSDTAFWFLIFAVIAVILIAALVVLEWLGRRDRRRLEAETPSPWELRSPRERELDVIVRGKDPRR